MEESQGGLCHPARAQAVLNKDGPTGVSLCHLLQAAGLTAVLVGLPAQGRRAKAMTHSVVTNNGSLLP